MDGIYQNNKSLKAWFERALKESKIEGFATVHVDQILGEQYEANSLQVLLSLFQSVIALLREQGEALAVLPMLVVPLEDSSRVDLYDVDIQIEDQMIDEPSSLYLVSRKQLMHKDVAEEYKRPIQINLDINDLDNYFVYYRCFRDQVGIDHGWEYSRAVYFEYYPDALL